MIKTLKHYAFLPFFVLIIDFAISNRESVALSLWPLPYNFEIPIYLLLIAIFIISTIICGIVSWFSINMVKREIKETRIQIAKVKEENALLRQRIENFEQQL